MALEDAVAFAGLLGVMAYSVLGGADFGGGVWDLFAAGPRRDEQRRAIAHAMGPVWEANHVWLIFVIVLLFTAFPAAFAALSIALFGLFHFVLLGVTLRGAAFVFRGPEAADRGVGHWGTVFGVASVITPLLLGMAVGVVSSGSLRVADEQVAVRGPTPWLAPVSLAIGALALALCAYLAAVYLTNETQGELQEDFRRRALLAGTFVVGLAGLALPLLYVETPHLWGGLVGPRAAPVLALGVVTALLSGWALLGRRFRLARAAAATQVALLLFGWGLAQYPYLMYPDVTVAGAAAPEATLRFVLYALPVGMGLLLPSLWFLLRVFKAKATSGVGGACLLLGCGGLGLMGVGCPASPSMDVAAPIAPGPLTALAGPLTEGRHRLCSRPAELYNTRVSKWVVCQWQNPPNNCNHKFL
jgi:cytochrome d ubiquinol oxidase subunit II